MLGQHGLLQADPLLLPHNSQIPVSLSQGANLAIPTSGMQLDGHNSIAANHQQPDNLANQNQLGRDVRVNILPFNCLKPIQMLCFR